uniref:Adipocyte plasma membrane-associated protein n=1 Tax=Ciona savignyi TaxID=51511 RepID=H2Y805_CIOSA
MPDNLRRNSRGNYWVAASSKHSPMVAFLGKFPSLRQIIIGLIPQSVILRMVDSNHCMLFEVNSSGELIQTLHDPNGDLAYALSQGTELSDGRIALGSYKAQFLAITDE